jgi:hypothetical protein
MSTDTPRTLKDALTEAIQAALHNVRGMGDGNADLKRSLNYALDDLYGHKDIAPERIPELRLLLNSAYTTLHGLAEAKGAVMLIDGAIDALEKATTRSYGGSKANIVAVDEAQYAPEIKPGTPGQPYDERTHAAELEYRGAEDFKNYIDRVRAANREGAKPISGAPPPTRRELAYALLLEAGALSRSQAADEKIEERLNGVAAIVAELEGDYEEAQNKRGDYRRALDQVLTYAHRRLHTFPPPDGRAHLRYVLKLAAGATTLQSPPTDAEIAAAYSLAKGEDAREEAEDKPEAERTPDAMLALGLALVNELQEALTGQKYAGGLSEEDIAGRFAGLRNLIKDLAGGTAAVVADGLDHIPGSILEELEESIRNLGDVAVVKVPDIYAEWRDDNLERLRILRGCFAAYAKRPETEGRLGDGAEMYPLSLFNTLEHNIETGQPGGDEGEAWRLDSLEAIRILKDKFIRGDFAGAPGATQEAEPEHEHNVMCLPYHSALREIERRINIYRDDTLEAYNDFGEAVVSKSTITAVNTFTAQLIKIITDVAGDTKGYNKGTVEREAHADKGYPKPHLLPTGAHNALVAAKEGLKTVLNGVREANTDESLSETFIKDRVNVVLRYSGYEYVRDALKAVERELHIEITGDKRLPIPEGAEERLAEKREIIDNLNADKIPGVVAAQRHLDTLARAIFAESPVSGVSPQEAMGAVDWLRQFVANVPAWLQQVRIEEQDGAPDVMRLVNEKLGEMVTGKPERAVDDAGKLPETVVNAITEAVRFIDELLPMLNRSREQGQTVVTALMRQLEYSNNGDFLGTPPPDVVTNVPGAVIAQVGGVIFVIDPALPLPEGAPLPLDVRGKLQYEPIRAVEDIRRTAERHIRALDAVQSELTAADEEEKELLLAAADATAWLKAYFLSPEGAPINLDGIPPAVLDRIRERIERAVTEHLAAPFKSGGKDRLVAALKDASSALKDAADGSPRILRYEITEGTHNLLTISAIETINTLHAALWTCEAERNIYASLGMLGKIRHIVLALDAKAAERAATDPPQDKSREEMLAGVDRIRQIISSSAPVTLSVVTSGKRRDRTNAYEDAINLLGGIESNLFVPLEGGGVKVAALQTLQDETRRKAKALRDCIEDLDLQLGDARRDLKRANKLKATVISENNTLRQKTTVKGYERLNARLQKAREELDIAEQEASTASLRESEAKRELERVEEERRIATEGLHSARGEEAQLRQICGKQTQSIQELLETRSALRQDNELLSRENELQGQSIIAYMFVVQRLRGCLRAFLDLYKAQVKAVNQVEDGKYGSVRPDKAHLTPEQYALDLIYEIKALAESARTMGEEELQLLDKACPSFKMSTREGLTEY